MISNKAGLADFDGSMDLKFQSFDTEIKNPRVEIEYQSNVMSSVPEQTSKANEFVPGTFCIDIKGRGATSDNVVIRLFDGETYIGSSMMKVSSLMKGQGS